MQLATRHLTVALAGNPNSGKTTIFNALTGLRQKVANYPGVTVEKKLGRCKLPDGETVDVIDLPGTYSLVSRSPDEQVAMEVLRGLRPDTPAPDVVICVIDASNLQRNLYLLSQLVEVGRPMVVALNMTDVAARRGLHISADRLGAQLGVPVVAVVAHQKKGIDELKAAIDKAKIAPMPAWPLPAAMHEEVVTVGGGLAILLSSDEATDRRSDEGSSRRLASHHAVAERLLIGDRAADIAPLTGHEPVKSLLDHANNRLKQLGVDPMQADIEAHYRWIDDVAAKSLVPACEVLTRGGTTLPAVSSESNENQDLGRDAHATSTILDYAPKPTFTDRLDRILLHKVGGLAIFALVMAALFVSIFWLADPIMGATENGIKWLGGLVSSILPAGPVKDLWTDGIVAGVGGVMVFIPQIALLFLFLAILEDSGYLARAAFLMDRVLSKVGLHGKSFIPLLSSFACAIPGIMAARTIECRRDRLATIFVAPFMSCSARLPVYALLITTFFASVSPLGRGGILLALYALGIIAAFLTALIFKIGAKREVPTAFILELPTYKRPQVSQIARVVWMNTWAFVSKAGTIIFCLSVILWASMYYPRLPESRMQSLRVEAESAFGRSVLDASSDERLREFITIHAADIQKAVDEEMAKYYEKNPLPENPSRERISHDQRVRSLHESTKVMWAGMAFGVREQEIFLENYLASAQLRHSYAGRLGHLIEPVIKPLGYDWKMGVGLIGAFAAREVFVSTMGIVYSVGDDDEDTQPLAQAMLADRYADGRRVWTPLVATSLLVWFVLAMQCMSTLAIVRRETGTWRWPLLQLVYMTGLAYVVSLLVYQVGRIWFA